MESAGAAEGQGWGFGEMNEALTFGAKFVGRYVLPKFSVLKNNNTLIFLNQN